MKALLLSDLHLHQSPLWRLQWNSEFISDLITSRSDDYELFLLGDVFEVKDRIDCRVVNQFLELVGKWKNHVYWITGQHDSYQPSVASLEGLSNLGITVVDRAVVKHPSAPVYFVPYQRDVNDYRMLLKKVPDDVYVMTHIPTEEALFAQGVEHKGISVKEFLRFKATYSGDIHTYQTFSSVPFYYVGTPSQRDWRDKNAKGAFGIFDLSGESEVFKRKLTKHPQHIEVKDENDKLPEGRDLIIKTPPNVTVDNINVIEQTVKYTPENRPALSGSRNKTVDELLSDYVKSFDFCELASGCNDKQLIEKGKYLYEQSSCSELPNS